LATKGQKFNSYTAGCKLLVITDRLESNLSYSAVAKKYFSPKPSQIGAFVNNIKRWERQYQEGGIANLTNEHRGRPAKEKNKDKPVNQ